jgi:hypothetical protein
MVAVMDRSVRRLPDPVAGAPNGERRRRVRQKLHTPVYASFNGPETGMVVDLSELLDLNEEGFAVQAAEKLEMNRAVTLCLDLPETKSYIHGNGQVVWSDDSGRGGIRFYALPESSQKILKEWLFANLLIACSNHSARTEQRARSDEQTPDSAPEQKFNKVVSISTGSDLFASLETAQRELREIGDDIDAGLRFIAERALDLTSATGSAVAFLTDGRMICRARAGEPAPPLGAVVDTNQGLSGECVRGGHLVSCEDLENDPRVDPEIGRALGIGALMAAPIVSDVLVVGLLEIFSPHRRGFAKIDATVLDRLVEMIPKSLLTREMDEKTAAHALLETEQSAVDVAAEVPQEPSASVSASKADLEAASVALSAAPAPSATGPSAETSSSAAPLDLLSRALFGLVIVVVFVVVGYLFGPMIEKRWAPSPQAAQRSPSAQSTVNRAAATRSLPELQEIAGQGDADAQWQMGLRYHDGDGVPRDDAQAMQWYLRAAEQGNVEAQGALGSYYWAGRGVPVDLSKSYFWSTIAMAQGDEISKGRVEGLASQMTQGQVSQARQEAEAWIRMHSARAKFTAN